MRTVWLVLCAGCALTAKASPLDVRYFTPEPAPAPSKSGATTTPSATFARRLGDERLPRASQRGSSSAGRLRLGRVASSAHLRTRIVHRDSAIEVGEYVTLRWTENPEVYLRRSLERALFGSDLFARGYALELPVLDVELVAFEEVRTNGRHAGRVHLRYQLLSDLDVVASGSIVAEREATPGIESAVIAIGAAMEQATAALARLASERIPR